MCAKVKVLPIVLVVFCLGLSSLANGQVPSAGESTPANQAETESEEETGAQDDNVFASVELAATNAGLAIKLMKKALGVLLESSANAMESTESILRSGVQSVDSITNGASTAAKQIGIAPDTITEALNALNSNSNSQPKPQQKRKAERKLKPKSDDVWWFW